MMSKEIILNHWFFKISWYFPSSKNWEKSQTKEISAKVKSSPEIYSDLDSADSIPSK